MRIAASPAGELIHPTAALLGALAWVFWQRYPATKLYRGNGHRKSSSVPVELACLSGVHLRILVCASRFMNGVSRMFLCFRRNIYPWMIPMQMA
jgi:hypothetical protein